MRVTTLHMKGWGSALPWGGEGDYAVTGGAWTAC